jgi:hypothetical protein
VREVPALFRFALEEEISPWLPGGDHRVLLSASCTQRGAEPTALQRWFTAEGGIRTDPAVASEILQFVQSHGAK